MRQYIKPLIAALLVIGSVAYLSYIIDPLKGFILVFFTVVFGVFGVAVIIDHASHGRSDRR